MRYLAVVLAVLALWLSPVFAQNHADRVGYVNDFAEVIGNDTEGDFERELRDFHESVKVEVVVVTLTSLGGSTIQDHAERLYRQWRIGGKGVDNGVLLLGDRQGRRAHIEVGYGMEPYVTAAQVNRIMESLVMPEVSQDHYYLGLSKGTTAVTQAIKDSNYQPGSVRPRPATERVPQPVLDVQWGLYVAGAVSLYIISYSLRTSWLPAAGLWGAVVGGGLGWIAGGLTAAVLGAGIAGAIGLALAVALASAHRYQRRTGGPTTWAQSWGGFYGAGRSTSGGRGGGRGHRR